MMRPNTVALEHADLLTEMYGHTVLVRKRSV